MFYYDLSAEERQRLDDAGVDYDLQACLDNNPQDGFQIQDIKKVLAVWEGENDGDDWRWVLLLTDDRVVFLTGGCDYTGWDCQSYADSEVIDSPVVVADIVAREPNAKVQDSLVKQLYDGVNQTWRQCMDKEMGV